MARTHSRGPGRPRRPVSRERLLAAAREAFAESGYSGASMAGIAERAGIRKPSLFHHFANKEALYSEAVGEALAPLGSLVAETSESESGFLARLDRLSELVVDYFGGHRAAARLLVREVLDQGPFLSRGGEQAAGAILGAVTGFLEQGMDAGAFARRDARHLALSIIGIHLFYFAADPLSGATLSGDVFDPAEIASRKTAVVEQVRALVLQPPAE